MGLKFCANFVANYKKKKNAGAFCGLHLAQCGALLCALLPAPSLDSLSGHFYAGNASCCLGAS